MEIKESPKNIERIRRCPHYEYCESVKCPLDDLMCYRVKASGDLETCRLGKAKRMKIGSDMKTKGLNPYEIAALTRTHGTFQKGLESILNQNFRMKNEGKF